MRLTTILPTTLFPEPMCKYCDSLGTADRIPKVLSLIVDALVRSSRHIATYAKFSTRMRSCLLCHRLDTRYRCGVGTFINSTHLSRATQKAKTDLGPFIYLCALRTGFPAYLFDRSSKWVP